MAGLQGCSFGCLGFGDCVRACHYDAMHIDDGLATVDFNHCIGCGACSKVCPRSLITIEGFKSDNIPVVACSNKDKAKMQSLRVKLPVWLVRPALNIQICLPLPIICHYMTMMPIQKMNTMNLW